MTTRRKRNTNNQSEGFENTAKLDLSAYPWSVKNVRELSEKVLCFTLDLGIGVSLYNVKAVQGKETDFIAAAETKGNNGSYYRNYGLYLTDESQDKLLTAVYAEFDKK